jgi:hypothetical protein
MWDTISRSLSHLFFDVCLFFEINEAERMVFEDRRCANDMSWEHVELLFAGRSKAKHPYLRLNLTSFTGGSKFGRWTRCSNGQECRCIDCSVVATRMKGVVIHRIDVGCAIVESIAAREIEEHREEAIVAGEP